MKNVTNNGWSSVKQDIVSKSRAERRKLEFIPPVKASNGFKLSNPNSHITQTSVSKSWTQNVKKDSKPTTEAKSKTDSGIFPRSLVVENVNWEKISRFL
jgi:hypothetical protein